MVQDLGLALLTRQDNIRRSEQTVDDMRLASVASGERTLRQAFPEYFSPLPRASIDDLPEDDYIAADDEVAIYDYSQADLDMEAAAREIEMLAAGLADDKVTVSGRNDGWV